MKRNPLPRAGMYFKYDRIVGMLRKGANKYPMQSLGSCFKTDTGKDQKSDVIDGNIVAVCVVGAMCEAVTGDPLSHNSNLCKTGSALKEVSYTEICPECGVKENIIVIVRHHLNDAHGNHDGPCGCKNQMDRNPNFKKAWTLTEIADWLETL